MNAAAKRVQRTSGQRAPSVKAIHAVRLENLKELIEARFKGNAAKAAKAISRSHTFLWQLVNKRRSIGEDTARHIEEKLGLGYGALDRDASGALKQNTTLTVIRDDGTQQTFRMVPEVEFTAGLNKKKKPGSFRPCPIECSGGTVTVRVQTDSLEPLLHKGDDVFIDKEKSALIDGCVYALEVKGMSDPVLRIARRRDGGGWQYMTNKDDGTIEGERVSVVLGQAIYQGRPVVAF
jgi:hypothetical protein